MQASSPGEVLREARRSRDLSMEYIARQLRLAVNQIDALENDDYKTLPASIFVQGYIRSYASLLGLDSQPLVRRYVDSVGEQEHPKPSLADPMRVKKIKPPKTAFPVKSLGYVVTSGFILFALTVIYNTKNSEDEFASQTPVQVANKKPLTPVASAMRVSYAVNDKAVSNSRTRYIVSHGQKKGEHDTLSIRFKRATYVEVFDATNKALLEHTGRAGFRDRVKGKAPFRIKLGSPQDVVIRLNGQIFNHLRLSKKGVTKTILVNTR